jgi:phosphotransferase system  glucose/maltose/N-acetylglucosamine-specific IIC component
MKKLLTLLIALGLSSCVTAPVKYKDATNRTTTRIITNTPEADNVHVVDLRNKVQNSVQLPTTDSKTNWGEINTTVEEEYVVKDKTEEKPNTERRLFWFFFTMMALGLFGAGSIGVAEAISNRKKVVKKPRLKLKDGKHVPVQRKTNKSN